MKAKLVCYRPYTHKKTGELMYRCQFLVKDEKWEGGETVREMSVSSSMFPSPGRNSVYEVTMHLCSWDGKFWWNLDSIVIQ